MLNTPEWLVTCAHRRDHITPVLRQLLWLPVSRKSISNSWYLFTSHCMVLLRRTCVITVNQSRTWDVDISDLPTSTHVSCRGGSHRLATEVSLQTGRLYGTKQSTDRDSEERHDLGTLSRLVKPFWFVKSAAHSELNFSSPDISTLTHSQRPVRYIIITFTAISAPANGMRSVFVLFSMDENRDNIFLFRVINA